MVLRQGAWAFIPLFWRRNRRISAAYWYKTGVTRCMCVARVLGAHFYGGGGWAQIKFQDNSSRITMELGE